MLQIIIFISLNIVSANKIKNEIEVKKIELK